MTNNELEFKNLELRNEIYNLECKINKFLSKVKNIELDFPILKDDKEYSNMELNLLDDLKYLIKEGKKLKD